MGYNFEPMLEIMAQDISAVYDGQWTNMLKQPTVLDPKQLVIETQNLAQGNFGFVRKATLALNQSNVPTHTVVVKCLKLNASDATREDLFKEALISSQFVHDNIVACMGVVTIGTPLLVFEYYSEGSLQSCLQKMKTNMTTNGVTRPLQPTAQVRFQQLALQIALGMEYMHSKFFVHRDLATRNVLVSEYGICKIAVSLRYVFTGGSFCVSHVTVVL
jgi:serine/threonine protein kinase